MRNLLCCNEHPVRKLLVHFGIPLNPHTKNTSRPRTKLALGTRQEVTLIEDWAFLFVSVHLPDLPASCRQIAHTISRR